jgi:Rad3-related DNA helicase
MGKRQRRRIREQHLAERSHLPDQRVQRAAEDEMALRLTRLVRQRARIQHEIDAEVVRLQGRGVGWPAIARALGVTRQAARQRWAREASAAKSSATLSPEPARI